MPTIIFKWRIGTWISSSRNFSGKDTLRRCWYSCILHSYWCRYL